MVQEQAGIQILVQVHQQAHVVLTYLEVIRGPAAGLVAPLILERPPLALSLLEHQPLRSGAQGARQHPKCGVTPGRLIPVSLRCVEMRLRGEVPDTAAHPYFAHWPPLRGLFVWSIVMMRGGHQVPHIHPGGWMSGVYYAELPDVIEGTGGEHEGWIEFGTPPSGFPIAGTPLVRFIQPKAGRLFLFPSYFYHRTVPYRTDERRISIAFDYLPIG